MSEPAHDEPSSQPSDESPATAGGTDEDLLAALADEFAARARRGEHPTVEDYAARHPALAERIRKVLPAIAAIEGARADEPPAAAHGEGLGSTIGRYKLLERIGEGGFGVVYMAEQHHPVRRRVALKVVKPGMDSRQVLARFDAERQALAIMDHPNIAKVFDGGMTDSGRPYFVMELVKGEPITEFCDRSQLPPRQRLELFGQVCRAVQHAHQKGIIHRDIKPTNVLVSLHDATPVVKVIDFGIAKALGQELTEKTLFTGFAQLVGTPLYMSPEQAGESALDADTRSDIYSLGVLLYELLTGTTPFDKERFRKAAHDEIRRIIREEEPPKPSTRLSESKQSLPSISAQRQTEPAKLTKLVRGELDWIVMKALEKDRNRRYETANGLAMDVQRYLNDEAVQACPPSAAYRFRKFARRNQVALLVAFAAVSGLLLLVVGLAVTNRTVTASRNETADALRQKEAALDAEASARRATEASAERWRVQKQEADRERKRAEMEAANGLVLQGDALGLASRWGDAKPLYTRALDRLTRLRGWTFPAELGLWDANRGSMVLAEYKGHDGDANSVAFRRDGRVALSGGNDGVVILWDLLTGRPMRRLTGHAGQVLGVAFTPDGTAAISGGADGTVRLWDLTGDAPPSIRTQTAASLCVAVSPDGRSVVSGGADGVLRLWEMKRPPAADRGDGAADEDAPGSGRSLSGPREFRGHDGPVRGVAFSPDGCHAVSGGSDGTVRLWDLSGTGAPRIRRDLDGHSESVLSVAFSPDGRTVASGGRHGQVLLWDSAGEGEPRSCNGHTNQVTGVAFSPDGRTLLSGSHDGTLKRWNVADGREAGTLSRQTLFVTCAAFGPDGRMALSGSVGGELLLWDLTGGRECRPFTGHDGSVYGVAFCSDGLTALTGGQDRALQRWDLATGKTLLTFQGHAAPVMFVAVSPDGATALSGGSDWTVRLWDLATGRQIRAFVGHTGGVNAVAFAPDGRTALSASVDKTVRLWEVATGQELRTLRGHDAAAVSVAFAPDGRSAVSGGQDAVVRVWDTTPGGSDRPARTFEGRHNFVNGITFTPDGRNVLSAHGELTVRLWEVATGRELRTLRGHTHHVWDVACAPGGRWAVSVGADKTLRLWDVAGQRPLRAFASGHAGEVRRVRVSADGGRILSGGADGTARLWDFARFDARPPVHSRGAAADQHLGRNPDDPRALAAWGEWWALQGVNDWAVDLLGRARAGGVDVSPLTLARCHWELGNAPAAAGEFRKAIDRQEAPEPYLRLCLRAVESPATANATTAAIAGDGGPPAGFQFDYRADGAPPGWRRWERLDDGTWEERRETGQVLRFAAAGRYERDGQSGTILAKLPEKTPEVFVPDRGTGDLIARREGPNDVWRFFARITAELTAAEVAARGQREIADATRAVRSNPDDPKALVARAVLSVRYGSWDEAMADYRRAIEVDPSYADAHVKLGGALLEQQTFAEAMAAFQQAIERHPRKAEAYKALGVALAGQQKLDEAIACFTRAIEHNPKYAAAHSNLGLALTAQGKLDEAIDEYREALRLQPDSASTRSQLASVVNSRAWILATDPEKGDPRRAVVLAKEAVGLAPEVANGWNTLGVAQYRGGDWQEAISSLQKYRELRTGDAEWSNPFFLAMAHWQLGNKYEAVQWHTRAVDWMERKQAKSDAMLRFRAEADGLIGRSGRRNWRRSAGRRGTASWRPCPTRSGPGPTTRSP